MTIAPTPIEDLQDPRVGLYRGLPDAALRRRIEAEHGIFVVEGARSLRTLLESPFPLVSILLLPQRLDGLADVVAAAHERRAPVFVAGRRVFDGIAGFPAHRGVLALARRLPPPDPMTVLAQVTTAVVVEGVNDHENLGAIFRNAAALGAGAVLLDPSSCDPLYRRSVRVSMAHVLRVPFTRLAPWPDALAELGAAGFTVVALDPGAADTIDALAQGPGTARPPEGLPRSAVWETPGRPPEAAEPAEPAQPAQPTEHPHPWEPGAQAAPPKPIRLAVLVGGEGTGLTEGARRAASHRVRIPMAAGVDSLNVATALAIALHRLIAVPW
jgi:tRNA G18 (ribose-2'-O)-methylase SpoU